MSKSIRHKTVYKTKTNKYKSNRYSGYDHFKMKPYVIHSHEYIFQKWFYDNRSYLGEDIVSLVNKKKYRRQLKKELKNIIESEC